MDKIINFKNVLNVTPVKGRIDHNYKVIRGEIFEDDLGIWGKRLELPNSHYVLDGVVYCKPHCVIKYFDTKNEYVFFDTEDEMSKFMIKANELING